MEQAYVPVPSRYKAAVFILRKSVSPHVNFFSPLTFRLVTTRVFLLIYIQESQAILEKYDYRKKEHFLNLSQNNCLCIYVTFQFCITVKSDEAYNLATTSVLMVRITMVQHSYQPAGPVTSIVLLQLNQYNIQTHQPSCK